MSEERRPKGTYTPGPWTQSADIIWSPTGKANVAAVSNPHAGTTVGYTKITAWGDPDNFDEAMANARLIAAAPDLLAALEATVCTSSKCGQARRLRAQGHLDDRLYAAALCPRCDAIQRAKGQERP